MDISTFSDAVYRLGQVSANPPASTSVLLKRITEILAKAVGADFTALVVFEKGVERPGTAAQVVGPWGYDVSDRILEATRWDSQDRTVAMRLAMRERNVMYRRSDLIDEKLFKASRMQNELLAPMRLGDQIVGAFHRSDGAELMISFQSLEDHNTLTDAVLKGAQQLAAVVAQCWASSWHAEPQWMVSLKPQSRRVLEDVLDGYDDDQIAQRTGLTYHSVRAHLKRLFRDADVRSRLHLMQLCKSERFSAACIQAFLPQGAVVHTTVKSAQAAAVPVNGAARRVALAAG